MKYSCIRLYCVINTKIFVINPYIKLRHLLPKGRLSRGGVAYEPVFARSVVYWDRRQLAAVWVTGWWFGCVEQQTEKLLVVTNKQVTAKKYNLLNVEFCSDAGVRFVESCRRKRLFRTKDNEYKDNENVDCM